MKTAEKLKLFRTLHFLTQEEMVDLAVKTASYFYVNQGVTDAKEIASHASFSHEFYRGIESGTKKLPFNKATILAGPLFLNVAWLLGEEAKPLAGADLLIVEFPPRRLQFLAGNDRDRRSRESCSVVSTLLPQFLSENRLKHIWVGEASETRKLVLFNFSDDQYLLLCVNADLYGKDPLVGERSKASGYSVDYFSGTFRQLLTKIDAVPPVVKKIDYFLFNRVELGSLVDLMRFMDWMGVSEAHQEKIRSGLRTINNIKLWVAKKLNGPKRKEMLERITLDIVTNDIHLDEIINILRESERKDLLPDCIDSRRGS